MHSGGYFSVMCNLLLVVSPSLTSPSIVMMSPDVDDVSVDNDVSVSLDGFSSLMASPTLMSQMKNCTHDGFAW